MTFGVQAGITKCCLLALTLLASAVFAAPPQSEHKTSDRTVKLPGAGHGVGQIQTGRDGVINEEDVVCVRPLHAFQGDDARTREYAARSIERLAPLVDTDDPNMSSWKMLNAESYVRIGRPDEGLRIAREVLAAHTPARKTFGDLVGNGPLPAMVRWIESEQAAGRLRADLDARLTAMSIAGLTVFPYLFGPVLAPHLGIQLDDELVARVHEDLDRTLGLRGEPQRLLIRRWPRAVPQPGVDHTRRVAELRRRLDVHAGLEIAGSHTDGVSVADTLASGVAAAERLLARP